MAHNFSRLEKVIEHLTVNRKIHTISGELTAEIYSDSSLYLISSRFYGESRPDRITMPEEDTRGLYEILKAHFETETK